MFILSKSFIQNDDNGWHRFVLKFLPDELKKNKVSEKCK